MHLRLAGLSLLPPGARKPKLLARACRQALKTSPLNESGEINIVFLDRKSMRKMNRTFLKHGHDTDVIAFSYRLHGGAERHWAPWRSGARRRVSEPFGDIFVSAYQAARQAEDLEHSILEEAATLIIHGTLHLLGYEDNRPAARARMFKIQDAVLRRLRAGETFHCGR